MFKNAGGWMHGRWPCRPQPQPDETLSSYLTRTAHGLGVKPVRLHSLVWGSQRPLLYQDLDNHVPPHVASRIAEGVGIDERDVAAMTFAGLDGLLLTERAPNARKPWILPVSVTSNDRMRPGLQFCPACLAGDERPYYRRTWRLAFATCCTRHGVRLLDRCGICGANVHQHRAPSPGRCHACGADHAKADTVTAPREIASFQTGLERSLEEGHAAFTGRRIHSHFHFAILRQIASMVVNGTRAEAFRVALTRQRGGDPAQFEKQHPRHPVEYLPTMARERMMDLVRRAVEDAPDGFVAVCKAAGLSRSHVVKDMPYVPFAFEEILRDHLDDAVHLPDDAEVEAVARWLRATKGAARYRDLKALCGESRRAIYRHMDYERVPARRSAWHDT